MKHDTWKIWRPHGCSCETWDQWSACRGAGCVPCGDPVERSRKVPYLIMAALVVWIGIVYFLDLAK